MSVATSSSKDTEFLIRHSTLKGYQTLSLLTPPLYTLFTIYRRGRHALALNRLLRATWVGGVVGAAAGGGLGWARLRSQSPESLQDRRIRLTYNVRANQAMENTRIVSTIGSVLFAVLTPALFWRRAQMVNWDVTTVILGGAGLGSAVGILVHLGRSASEGLEVKPMNMAEELRDK